MLPNRGAVTLPVRAKPRNQSFSDAPPREPVSSTEQLQQDTRPEVEAEREVQIDPDIRVLTFGNPEGCRRHLRVPSGRKIPSHTTFASKSACLMGLEKRIGFEKRKPERPDLSAMKILAMMRAGAR